MSIYIHGMDMPKGKPICIIIDTVGQVRRYDLNNDKYTDDKLFEAIFVPPHGELIDLKAPFKAQYYDEMTEEWVEQIVTVEEALYGCMVDKMPPTIIPASEEE